LAAEPVLNVFARDGDGFRHRGAELMSAPGDEGEEPRHVGSIWPIRNVLDMTPGGARKRAERPRAAVRVVANKRATGPAPAAHCGTGGRRCPVTGPTAATRNELTDSSRTILRAQYRRPRHRPRGRPDRRLGARAPGAGLITESDVEPGRSCGGIADSVCLAVVRAEADAEPISTISARDEPL